ncbi:MAG: primosomal protein N' [Desulfovibrionaceae bacterium]|nr:primosomal protein N' [Desulfovibrionaceae bacterium]
MFADIELLSPPYGTLTYALPAYFPEGIWHLGMRVAVPVGTGPLRVGILMRLHNDEPDGFIVRPIFWPLEHQSLFSEATLQILMQLSRRQLVPFGRFLESFLPKRLRSTEAALKICSPDEGEEKIPFRELRQRDEAQLFRVGRLWADGFADFENSGKHSEKIFFEEAFWAAVKPDDETVLSARAVKQRAMWEYLRSSGYASLSELKHRFGSSCRSVLESLQKKHLVRSLKTGEVLPDLNAAQKASLAEMKRALHSGQSVTHLLFGVTGSGKTAVYLQLAEYCLSLERSVFLLAPEVALAVRLYKDAVLHLPHARVLLYHGSLSKEARERLFCESGHTEPCVIVGTRSALFLPLSRIGCIILDEEHDASFKQDAVEGVTYHAKELAWGLCHAYRALLVLGSATPDLKTFYAARQGLLHMSVLADRAGGGELPSVQLVDMRKPGRKSVCLAPESLMAIEEARKRDEQVIVMLNRRGYASAMYCPDCGKTVRCPHCDIGLTYHRTSERMICHYCGFFLPVPSPCPSCGGMTLLPLGQGTERLEEQLRGILPDGERILRLDRDSANKKDGAEKILGAFGRHEAGILVGTQMISKGLHFPDVTLAIIADGDSGLNLPDYRAAERTFQLLVQSSGRAGRGERPGRVLIQTADPEHYCWRYVLHGDYEGFFAHELELRRKYAYPPFSHVALLRFSCPSDWRGIESYMFSFREQAVKIASECGVSVLGPAPAPLARLNDRKRFQCLVKSPDWPSVRRFYAAVCSAVEARPVRMSLDLDPVSMM